MVLNDLYPRIVVLFKNVVDAKNNMVVQCSNLVCNCKCKVTKYLLVLKCLPNLYPKVYSTVIFRVN